jgi:hypothetical protein
MGFLKEFLSMVATLSRISSFWGAITISNIHKAHLSVGLCNVKFIY